MGSPPHTARSFFVVGGTVPPDSPSYVERRADSELIESIHQGEICYILTARQMGKSSLMARTIKYLRQHNFRTASIDLAATGQKGFSADQWYMGFSRELIQELGLTVDLDTWWHARQSLPPLQRLKEVFSAIILPSIPEDIVVFVDEIDTTIGLPFSDDFFAAIRSMYNLRAIRPEYRRLCFVLLGVASPIQLIQDPTRTPFNVGRRIELTDFTQDEACILLPGLHLGGRGDSDVLDRILYWTGGHPYLTQKLCRMFADQRVGDGTGFVDDLVEQHFFGQGAVDHEPNLKVAALRLKEDASSSRVLLGLLMRIRQGRPVLDDLASPLHALLKLSGVVIRDPGGRLVIRNRIYHQVFTAQWAKTDRALSSVWQRRALRYAAVGDRDRSLLSWVKGVLVADQAWKRAEAAHLAGSDYETLLVTIRHSGAVTSVAYSPDGRMILTASDDGSAGLWDAATGEPVCAPLWHDGPVWTAVFSPDGGLIATASEDGSAVLWRPVNDPNRPLRLRHQKPVLAISFRPDGGMLATGCEDGSARLWKASDGSPTGAVFNHDWPVEAAVFAPDGQRLLTSAGGWEARLWEVSTGQPAIPALTEGWRILSLAFSPDGRWIVTAGENHSASLWDAATGEFIRHVGKHDGHILSVVFHPDGDKILTASNDRTAQLWSVGSGEPLGRPLSHEDWVRTAVFSRGGLVLTGGEDMTARCWKGETGEPVGPGLHHRGRIVRVAFSPGGETAVSASADGTARVWGIAGLSAGAAGAAVQHDTPISAMALSPDGRVFATASVDGTLRFFSAQNGRQIHEATRLDAAVRTIVFSEDGSLVLTGGDSATATLWRTGGRMEPAFEFELGSPMHTAALRPDLAATGTKDTAQLWSLASGEPVGRQLRHEGPIHAMLFHPEGASLLTSAENLVSLWRTSDTERLGFFFHESPVRTAVFSLDGHTVATGSSDHTARIFNLETGVTVGPPLMHEGSVDALAFSPNGKLLVTGSSDRTVRFWRAETGAPAAASGKQDAPIRAIRFSADGKWIFCLTDYWIHVYTAKGKSAASRFLPGIWGGAIHIPQADPWSARVAVRISSDACTLVTIAEKSSDEPLQGQPHKLLTEWENRLGLKVDESERIALKWPMRGKKRAARADITF